MELTDRKNFIKGLLICEVEKARPIGGQSCGTPILAFIVKSEELDIEIKVKSFKSGFKNKELAMTLMDLAIDEIIK